MDRRTFIQSTAATTGTLAVAGCLGGDDDPVPEITGTEGPRQYERPPYSNWPPAESYDTGQVVFLHVTLAGLDAVDHLTDSDRLNTSQPLVGLPLSSTVTIPEAVDTVTSYPFSGAIEAAVDEATGTTTETEPTTLDNTTTETDVDGTETIENETADGNETADSDATVGVAEFVGIETTELTLTDELLICHGSYDRAVFADRYTEGFKKVDQQRGVAIYEGVGGKDGLAFGVSNGVLIVPTEDSSRQSTAETILAHTLSGYINTLDRVVNHEDGEWLFETTGSATLSFGAWETPNAVELIAQSDPAVETPPADDPVFGSVESFISTLTLTVDDGTITAAEARFSGLFPPAAVPTEDDVQTGLVGDAASTEIDLDETRLAVRASFVDE